MNVPTTAFEDVDSFSCPCGSGISYRRCCAIYHLSERPAPTPETLMRSRYAAFALGGLGDYLFKTWDPDTRDPMLTPDQLDQRDSQWLGLDILDAKANGARGTVEFKAYFRPYDAILDTKSHALHERSRFRRHRGVWLYVDGVIDPPPGASVSRNAPCPCGSGKKAKRCCLQ